MNNYLISMSEAVDLFVNYTRYIAMFLASRFTANNCCNITHKEITEYNESKAIYRSYTVNCS